MGNAKKIVIHIPKSMFDQYFYSISLTISKFPWSAVKSWNKNELCFSKKSEMLKISKLDFNKEELN